MKDGNVRVLEGSVVARIAAAESVSRPAAIVKELVENSLDAGATRVEVTLLNAGKGLILVADNGEGMGPQDVLTSAQRHATSKIRTAEDLAETATLGFRGEALASVAAVSDLTIRSGKDGEGHEASFPTSAARPCPFIQGTRVEVRNLFKAVPARLSFLRSDRAEVLAVIEVIKGLSLSRPSVSFTLMNDERLTLDLRASSAHERVAQVLGRPFADSALPVSAEGPVGVEGWVSPASLTKGAASDQFLFVNGRHVRSSNAISAVRAGYGHTLPPLKHPGFVLFLTLPPGAVDVNAHPSKADVRFREPVAVSGAVEAAVKSALSSQAARPRRQRAVAQPDKVAEMMDGPLIIGDWEVFATAEGPFAVNRAQVIREILRASAAEDCFPATARASALSGASVVSAFGVRISAFGPEAALTAIPSDVPGDPVRLASLLGEARGAAAMEAAVSLWAAEALGGSSLAEHCAAERRPVDAEAFGRMMGRAR